jgi:hypothetical protein
MSVFVLILGVACLMSGIFVLTWREAIAARHRKRSATDTTQAPAAFAVMGGILGLSGLVFVLAALL